MILYDAINFSFKICIILFIIPFIFIVFVKVFIIVIIIVFVKIFIIMVFIYYCIYD